MDRKDKVTLDVPSVTPERLRRDGSPAEAVARDIRTSLRSLRNSRVFALAVVGTLALSIGATAVIVSAVEAVLLRPLPASNLDRVVTIGRRAADLNLHYGMQAAEVFALEQRRDLFDAIAGYRSVNMNLTGLAAPQRVAAVSTTGGFFDVFGIRPHLGRLYDSADERRGATNVVVLSFELWRDLTGGDDKAIGRRFTLNDSSYTILGVTPPGFAYPLGTQLWTPKTLDIFLDRHATRDMQHAGAIIPTIARIHGGMTLPRLQGDLAAALHDWGEQEPQYYKVRVARPIEARAFVAVWAGQLQPILVALTGAVALVLLIACANIGSLQLLRTTGRAREIAVRMALGGSRAAIVRQFAIETLVLAACGGALGIALAEVLLATVGRIVAAEIPELHGLHIDLFVLACSAIVTIAAAMVFAVGPALRTASANPRDALSPGGARSHSAGAARSRFLRGAVVTQIALALVLLLSCSVAVRSLTRLMAVDPGFDPSHVVTARLVLPRSRYDFMTLAGAKPAIALHERLLSGLRATSGIDAATTIETPPFGFRGVLDAATRRMSVSATIGPDAAKNSVSPNFWNVDADYFHTMRIPMHAGPGFTGHEQDDQVLAYPKQLQIGVVIDDVLARRLFPGQNAVGKLIGPNAPGFRVVGVVGSVKKSDLSVPTDEAGDIYFPTAGTQSEQTIIVRTRLSTAAASSLLRTAVRGVDPELPLFDIQPLQTLLSRSVGPRQIASSLLVGFAALSLLLALLGIYGVSSYMASQRTKEMGIRLALGATPVEILSIVLSNGAALTLAGLIAGTMSYLALERGLSAVTYGVSGSDPIVIAIGAAVLACAAGIAVLPAAIRSARANPVDALRAE